MKSSHEGTDSSNQALKAWFEETEFWTLEIVHDNKFWSIWSSSTQFTLLSI